MTNHRVALTARVVIRHSAPVHRLLDHLLSRSSYTQKMMVIAFVGTHVPLLFFIVYGLGRGLSPTTVFWVVLAGTVAGTAALLSAVHALLEPVRAARRGLEDYLQQRVLPQLPEDRHDDAGRLLRSVSQVCRDLESERQRLVRRAEEDQLTGLLTRRAGTERLNRPRTGDHAQHPHQLEHQHQREHQLRGEQPWCLALLDMDHFKQLNDRYGHHTGDEALRACANTLREQLPAGAWAARWGGEEILIACQGELAHCEAVLERIRHAVSELRLGPGGDVRVSASIGLAQVLPGEDPQSCVRRADEALYAAKAAGRDRVVSTAVV